MWIGGGGRTAFLQLAGRAKNQPLWKESGKERSAGKRGAAEYGAAECTVCPPHPMSANTSLGVLRCILPIST